MIDLENVCSTSVIRSTWIYLNTAIMFGLHIVKKKIKLLKRKKAVIKIDPTLGPATMWRPIWEMVSA